MKPKEAFPRKTINAIFTLWDNVIKSRECLSVVNIPKRDQLYRLKEITSRYRRIKNIQLIALDLKGQIIEDPYDLKTKGEEFTVTNQQLRLKFFNNDKQNSIPK